MLGCLSISCRVSPGELPTLQQLGFDSTTLSRCASDSNAAGAHLHGGESEALRRLSEFISKFTAQKQAPSSSRSGDGSGSNGQAAAQSAAPNFCCKISPWLALGCLSPRQLYVQLQQQACGQQAAAQQLQGTAGEGDAGGWQKHHFGVGVWNA